MSVTELALLRLLPGFSLDEAKQLFKKIAHTTEVYTGKPGSVQYWQQTEDPNLIYLFGTWNSLSDHMDGFIPTDGNQKLLAEAEGKISIELFRHYEVNLNTLPTRAEVISIARHFVDASKKNAFADCRERVKPEIDGWVTEAKPEGGWRVEAEKEDKNKDEYVLVCGWKTLEQHFEFGNSQNFVKYKEIRDFMDEFEVKHAKKLSL